jgi:CheY-like chemotaxis protein
MTHLTILCVDNERIILLSLRDQINKFFGDRYRYEFAESVEEAWEVIEELSKEKVKILLIISDWFIRGIEGNDFLIKVRQYFPDIVTVLLSGQADEIAIENAKVHASITKPWDEETLINVIKSGLEKLND